MPFAINSCYKGSIFLLCVTVIDHYKLKESCLTRDFCPLIFSSNNFPWASGRQVKAVSNISSNSRRYSTKLVVQCTSVTTLCMSMIPLCISQKCHWHRCAYITAVPLTPLCNQLCWISLWMIRSTVFMRKSDSAAHGTVVSMTPLCHYGTAVALVLIFERLWLTLKKISKNIHRQSVLHNIYIA
jgi:hypothetical protein